MVVASPMPGIDNRLGYQMPMYFDIRQFPDPI